MRKIVGTLVVVIFVLSLLTLVMPFQVLAQQNQSSCEDQVDGLMVQYGTAISGVGQLRQELKRLQKENEELKKKLEVKKEEKKDK